MPFLETVHDISPAGSSEDYEGGHGYVTRYISFTDALRTVPNIRLNRVDEQKCTKDVHHIMYIYPHIPITRRDFR